MIGSFHPRSTKAKHIIITVAIMIMWQFSFPSSAAAVELNESAMPADTATNESAAAEPKPVLRLPETPDKPRPEAKRTLQITVTAYSSTPDQTSGDPFITASGSRVHDGVIAANFLPIGTKVRFPEKFGDKIFTVEDRTHARYWQRADIWMETREAALQWGVQYTTIEIL
ncbi:MAG: 3D domain-containing protein [Patescibacteria group bacterium]